MMKVKLRGIRLSQLSWLRFFLILPYCQGTLASNIPNFVFILTDDISAEDLGMYGNKHIHTPTPNNATLHGDLLEWKRGKRQERPQKHTKSIILDQFSLTNLLINSEYMMYFLKQQVKQSFWRLPTLNNLLTAWQKHFVFKN